MLFQWKFFSLKFYFSLSFIPYMMTTYDTLSEIISTLEVYVIEHAGSTESTESTVFGCPLGTENNIGIENSREISILDYFLGH